VSVGKARPGEFLRHGIGVGARFSRTASRAVRIYWPYVLCSYCGLLYVDVRFPLNRTSIVVDLVRIEGLLRARSGHGAYEKLARTLFLTCYLYSLFLLANRNSLQQTANSTAFAWSCQTRTQRLPARPEKTQARR
jgi:hypothetical protein